MARVLQVGAIAVVVAVSTYFAFELDRFFVPKELVLHVTAVVAGAMAMRRIELTRRDWLLTGFLGLSVLSTVFATNPWLAARAVAISASGILLFWAARVAGPRVLHGVAIAVVLVAVTSLLQTYGIETTLFSENRAPGGTLGNRNFVAHAAAFGLPVLLLLAVRMERWFLAPAIGAAIVTASLVLTRSRAAWLAFAAVVIVFVIGSRAWKRLAIVVVFTGIAVTAALLIPNALRWRSGNPYLETLERVADARSGSGRGRLIQYEQSLRMAAHHPLLGVGPGNWAVRYPEHARRNDPSMSDTDGGMTTNPWPSSDWIAFVSERGLLATLLLAAFFLALAFQRHERAALLATLAGAGITGAFDAVLLLALPAFLVWVTLGALSPPPATPGASKAWLVAIVLVISLIGAARSTSQLIAMHLYTMNQNLRTAASIDPANYRLQLRLARSGNRTQRCEHAIAAKNLFPNADSARAASRGCREDRVE
jgi:O-antigen ligase